MAITTVYTYPLNGSTRDFNIPFEYLARRFVTLTLIGQDRRELVLLSDYRFTSKSTVQTNVAWGAANGYEWIEIRRNTSATDRLVDFSDGSILRASDLNVSQVQTMHIAEEARNMVADTIAVNNDGNLDARGRRLVNLADAVEPGDAVTLRQEKQWAGSALNQADRAKNEADRATNQANAAAGSANAAKTSENNSKASENNSKASENNAKTSENNAKGSETRAKTSESNAGGSASAAAGSAATAATEAGKALTQADRAKLEADKLGNMNGYAGLLDGIWGTGARYKVGTDIQAPGGYFTGGINVWSGADDSGANNGALPLKSPTIRFINGPATESRWYIWAGNGGALNFERPGLGIAMVLKSDRTAEFQGPQTNVLGHLEVGGPVAQVGEYLRVNNSRSNPNDPWYAMLRADTLILQGGNGGNKHLWFRDVNGAELALIYVDAGGTIRFRVKERTIAAMNTQDLIVTQNLYTGDGRAYLGSDGNVGGSMWGGRSLSDWLRDPGWEMHGATHIFAQNKSGAAIGPGGVTGGENLIWSSQNNAGGGRVNFGQWKCCGYANGDGVTLWRRVG